MIRLTLFYLFSFMAVLSCVMIFFTKNHAKTSILFFSVFLFSSLICVIFRNLLPALAILIFGAFSSFLFAAVSLLMEKHVVPARGATPKYLKAFSALCCIGFFFAVISYASGLQYSSLNPERTALQDTGREKKDSVLFFYLSGLAVLPVLSVFAGRRVLVYSEDKKK